MLCAQPCAHPRRSPSSSRGARADLPRMPRPRGRHTAPARAARRHHPGEAGAVCSRGRRGSRPAARSGARRAGPRTRRAAWGKSGSHSCLTVQFLHHSLSAVSSLTGPVLDTGDRGGPSKRERQFPESWDAQEPV